MRLPTRVLTGLTNAPLVLLTGTERKHTASRGKTVCAGRGDVFPLPTNAPDPQAHDLVGTQTGVDPHDGHRANQIQWVAERATRSAADAGQVRLGQTHGGVDEACPHQRVDITWAGPDLMPHGARSTEDP